jgi:flagellar motor switch protein FliN
MSLVPIEVINGISGLQGQIWQTVTLTASEAGERQLNFTSPLTLANKTSDLYSELSSPMLVIQFAFAGLPENPQVLLIPQETMGELAVFLNGEESATSEENIVAEIRPVLESIVQGICLAVGNVKNEPVVASGLSIRFQIFSFPPNFQRVEEVLRTQVAITSDELNGSAMWLMDSETAQAILGVSVAEQDPIPAKEASSEGGARATSSASSVTEDASGLDLLMDIPLEISVELGRVKMLVKDVVELGTGSVVEIDKAAGEPVDVLVNGRVVARGEVVVIEDNFGVRITEILNPQERLARLNEAA